MIGLKILLTFVVFLGLHILYYKVMPTDHFTTKAHTISGSILLINIIGLLIGLFMFIWS